MAGHGALEGPSSESKVPWVENPEAVVARRWSRFGMLLTLGVLVATLAILRESSPRLLTWGEIYPPDESLVIASLGWIVIGSVSLILAVASRRAVHRVALTPSSLYVELPGPQGARVVRLPWTEILELADRRGLHLFPGIRLRTSRTMEVLVLLSPELTRSVKAVWVAGHRGR
ncbi:MAG: hypothetical protein L3J96_07250 [Thermoplasmata archaeon]|nr:hypothetical protein [Thermoplasmata archaeon]